MGRSYLKGLLYNFTMKLTFNTNLVVLALHKINVLIERMYRYLLEITRALLFQSYRPIKLWGNCSQYAAYIINRMPLTNLNGMTLYKKEY